MYTITTNETPKVEDGIALYVDAGWGKAQDYNGLESSFAGAYQHSHFILAKDGQKLVGMIRYLTDGFHDTQIIECVVLKAYQNQGIAEAMLTQLKQMYTGSAIYIQSTESARDFFIQQGFKKHTLVGLSCAQKWKTQAMIKSPLILR